MRPEISLIAKREGIKNDPARCFSKKQRAQIFQRAGGRCEICGKRIDGKWIAGHFPIPHSMGGRTDISNGRVECLECSPHTARTDNNIAKKTNRIKGKTGQRARRAKRGGGSIKSRPFDRRFKKKLNGKTERRDGAKEKE